MKILIVTPTYLPDITGNAVTARRLKKRLMERGVEVDVVKSSEVRKFRSSDSCQGPRTPNPELIIHALHALKGGLIAGEMADEAGAPLVITITGTDLNIDLFQHGNENVTAVLNRANKIIVYSAYAGDSLASRLPSVAGKIQVIKPSVDIDMPEAGPGSLPDGFNFLLPSGIRRVKDPSFAIRPLEALRKEHPALNLTIAGPVLDEIEWKKLIVARQGRDWIHHRTVSHEEMPEFYASADVVLNTSISEGLSNAVLEAMFLGKAVLASDCEGNRAVISDGTDGLLYRQGDEEDFLKKAGNLVLDAGLKEKLGRAAREKVLSEYRSDAEIAGHLKLYNELLQE